MGTDRWVVKFAAREPERFDPEAHIPVFHRWIQQKTLPLVLIDVADYAHVKDGPGVLLVSHEYNIFADRFDGKAGLTVQRKLRGGAGAVSLADTLRVGLLAVQALTAESSLPGSRFHVDRVEVVANDRLRAPNDAEGWAATQPALQDVARKLYDGSARVEREATNSGQRLTAHIGGNVDDAGALLKKIQG
ncbi:MAG TPA: hypothetical protein VGK20_13290 [Candidatus Binatia bacterium]|jgi:hypothetical protein